MKDDFKDSNSKATSDDVGKEYIFQSSGIRERKGYVPTGLVLIAIGLIIWALYYLFFYWSPN